MTEPGRRLVFARPLDRRGFLRAALAASAGGAALALGCGGGDDGTETATVTGAPSATGTPGAGTTATAGAAVTPALLTSEFVAGGNNRFAVGLLDAERRLVKDAQVRARFFTVDDENKGTFRGEGDLNFIELNVEGAHTHDSTTDETAAAEDSVAFYIVNAPFDEAGRWGVELTVTPLGGGEPTSITAPFEVLAESKSPALGTLPPASQNDTTATNPDTGSLCTRDPICGLHDLVIGDVLGKGRPLVVQFSTPAFCETRFCGPVLEVLLQQVPKYRDRVDFVHIEVWEDFQAQKQRQAVAEWRLPTEPYTFFMSADGRVVGKLEAIFSDEELVGALDALSA